MSSKKIFFLSQYKLQDGVRIPLKRVILEILRSTLFTVMLVVGSRVVISFFQDRWDFNSFLTLIFLSPMVIVAFTAYYFYMVSKWNKKLLTKERDRKKIISCPKNHRGDNTIKYYQLGKDARIGHLTSLAVAVLMSCILIYICIASLIKGQPDNRVLVLIAITVYIVPLTAYRVITAADICFRKIYFSDNKMYFKRDDKILKVFDPLDIQKNSQKNNRVTLVDRNNKKHLILLEENEFNEFVIDFKRFIEESSSG